MGSTAKGGRWSSPSDVDLVNLDLEPSRAPHRRWGRRESRVTAVVAGALTVVIVGALLRPEAPLPVEVVGLTERPQVAWVVDADSGQDVWRLGDCAGDGIALMSTADRGSSTVSCRGSVDGVELWRRSYPTQQSGLLTSAHGPFVVVLDQQRGEASVLARDDGRDVATLRLPAINLDAGELSAVAFTDRGTLLINSSTPGDWEGITVNALDVTGGGRGLWTARVDRGRAGRGLSFGGEPLVEYGGFLWDRSDVSDAGFGLALNSVDGSVPDWSRRSELMTFSGDVVLGTVAAGGAVAYDLASGEALWGKQRRGLTATAGLGAFFLIQPTAVPASLDPVTGARTQQHDAAKVTRVDPRSGRERWTTRLDHAARVTAVVDDALLVAENNSFNPWNGGEAVLSALDARTGEVRWTRRFPQSHLGFMKGGDGVVVVELAGPTVLEKRDLDESSTLIWLTGHESTVVGFDLASGEDRWRLDLERGSAQVIGRHLVTQDESGTITVYR
ncbi:hypothetical protein BW730_15250 [Tessaracoccus aquimaris]|uniref:Pyrrolo-quinoline quinone repeat domain-containing protein n=1 Tax=Tessaracoccus aquimaris TaxID=1332264 RepID=A0A1Q2CRC3_9ACTN|nr:PQQ-binding-like beta-propeller repeat protein [Tessaracoccus aquimaris]AQP48657.1 hypothetical protein BW730_15250 [Tessaracoccus aquimaris]